MVATSKLAVALHVVTSLAYHEGKYLTSDNIARSVNTNPVVVRRILSDLARAGIVDARRGKLGGARLARKPREIRLLEIYHAINCAGPFCLPAKPSNKGCVVGAAMSAILSRLIGDIDLAIEHQLDQRTVADLVTEVNQL